MVIASYGGGYFTGDGRGSSLSQPLQQWVYRHPSWTSIPATAEGPTRRRTALEVAERLVEDPELLAVLGALQSPVGQAIEEAVLKQWMDPVDAQLMTAAVTRAARIIRNQNVPVWQRGEVLLGAAGLIVVVCVIAAIVHHSHQQSASQKKRQPASRQRPHQARRSR